MILAVIFLYCVSGVAPVTPFPAGCVSPVAPAIGQDSNQGSATSVPPSPAPPATTKSPASSAGQTTSNSKTHPGKSHRKKAPPPVNCNPDSPATNAPASADSKQPASAPHNCPPSKIIVRQGGASESNIQLAGGRADRDDAEQKRDAVNQMLGSTDANLKKIAGRQLAPAEQDTVAQIGQFKVQSRTALDAGDLERARVLAWKAELLSEDLVNPKK
jgi:hypothetical protein